MLFFMTFKAWKTVLPNDLPQLGDMLKIRLVN